MTSRNKDFQELQRRFAGHIRDPDKVPPPEGLEDRRMGIYRDLFFNNIKGFLSNNFPVLRKLHSDADWNALVRDFFVRHRAHTPLFPELPREFLKFLETERAGPHDDPPFMLELAHYEWVELALSLDQAEIDSIAVDPDGDLLTGRPVLSPLAWRLSYRYPVHRIRPSFRPEAPPAEPTHLVVYRRRDDKVRFLELKPVSARLLQLIEEHPDRTGQQHLGAIATELGSPDPRQIITAGSSVLRDFHEREIILGTAPEGG